MVNLLDKLSKPLLVGGLTIMSYLPLQQNATAQDLGGLVNKIEKSEKNSPTSKNSLDKYFFREDELPEGYKLVVRTHEENSDYKLNIEVYEKNNLSNKDEISKFGLAVVKEVDDKGAVGMCSAICFSDLTCVFIPFLVKPEENKEKNGSIAIHLILPMDFNKLDIDRKAIAEFDHQLVLQEVNEKYPALGGDINKIISSFYRVSERLKKDSVKLKRIDNLVRFCKEGY